MPTANNNPDMGNGYRVKLVAQRSENSNSAEREVVVFDSSPDVNESRTVNYSSVDPIHMPGQIYVYKNVQARTFQISNARLISRTPEEAEKNLGFIWTLRGWQMPRFGINSQSKGNTQRDKSRVQIQQLTQGVNQSSKQTSLNNGPNLLGAPPEVLLLSAYSSGASLREHIKRVPVVIQQLSIPYPTDVDYVMSTSGVPMPIIWPVELTLLEAHSAREYEQFNLDDYKQGRLPNF